MSSSQGHQGEGNANANHDGAAASLAAATTNNSYAHSHPPAQQHAAAAGTATMTITETPPASLNDELLSLSLQARPSVTWDDSVIDNEGMGRKSSKRCCIFHKQRAFDESSTDTSDYDSDRSLSSAASGASGDGKMPAEKPGRRKIARPKQGKKTPDSQRYHA